MFTAKSFLEREQPLTHLVIWEQFDHVGPEEVDSVLRAVTTTDYLLDAREYGLGGAVG